MQVITESKGFLDGLIMLVNTIRRKYIGITDELEDRPYQGHTSEIRRISMAMYHRTHKIIMIEQVIIRKEKMAEAVYHNNSRDFFSEVRKMNAGKRSPPVSVDGRAENNDICQMFSNKYDHLYNSVSYDADLFQKIKDKINQG